MAADPAHEQEPAGLSREAGGPDPAFVPDRLGRMVLLAKCLAYL